MSHQLLTAILPTDADVLSVVRQLKEQGVLAANVQHARGMGRVTRDRNMDAAQAQRDVLSVVVPAEQADALFGWLFEAADIGRPHGGILYSQPLRSATPYSLPDVPEEEAGG